MERNPQRVGLLRVRVGKPPRNRGFFLVLVGGVMDRATDKRGKRRKGEEEEEESEDVVGG